MLQMASWGRAVSAAVVMFASASSTTADAIYGTKSAFLPVEKAFPVSVVRQTNSTLVRWTLSPGYHLYRDRISIEAQGEPIPVGRMKFNRQPLFNAEFEPGFQYQLEGHVEVMVNVSHDKPLVVRYQGCSAQGLCYPPQRIEVAGG